MSKNRVTVNKDSLEYTLGEMSSRLESIDNHLKTLNSSVDKNRSRINLLERFKDEMIGKQTVVGGIAGFVFGLIGAFMSKFFGM